LAGIGKDLTDFLGFEVWGKVQRRGVHVNTPKIGSRVGGNCFGGILRFHAELRREFEGGIGNWSVLGFLGGKLTWEGRRGGSLCVFCVCWGIYLGAPL
jgi:hypothetical protein